MTPTALQTANTIIRQSLATGHMVDQLKLQKLLYLAQGISLAVRDRPLFPDKIEAWQYGPVVRSVYNAAKHHGAAPIAATLRGVHVGSKTIPESNSEAQSIVNETLRVYGDLTGVQLVALTHRPNTPEGQPWVNARARANPLNNSPTISVESMHESFKSLLQQQRVL